MPSQVWSHFLRKAPNEQQFSSGIRMCCLSQRVFSMALIVTVDKKLDKRSRAGKSYPVTAPSDADFTVRAYFASTPEVYTGAVSLTPRGSAAPH